MARRRRIKPIQLESTVKEILSEYGEEVYEVLDDCVNEVAEESASKLRQVNHFAPGGHPTGAYAKSWTNEKQLSGYFFTKQVVFNAEHYRLTHLLENGHVIRNGTGRTFGRTGEYPHIAPVDDWANAELPAKVEREIKKL